MRAAGGMASLCKVAGFKQRGAHQADLDYLTADAVDLNPVAHAHAVLAHENKPAEKGENEILQCDRECGGGQTQDGWHLLRRSQRPPAESAMRRGPAIPSCRMVRNVCLCLRSSDG